MLLDGERCCEEEYGQRYLNENILFHEKTPILGSNVVKSMQRLKQTLGSVKGGVEEMPQRDHPRFALITHD